MSESFWVCIIQASRPWEDLVVNTHLHTEIESGLDLSGSGIWLRIVDTDMKFVRLGLGRRNGLPIADGRRSSFNNDTAKFIIHILKTDTLQLLGVPVCVLSDYGALEVIKAGPSVKVGRVAFRNLDRWSGVTV